MFTYLRKASSAALKHGLHPPLTDFPLALWTLLVFSDLAALWFGAPWWRVGFWLLAGSLLAALAAAGTGLIESRRVPDHGNAQRTLNAHMLLMGTALTIFIGNAVVRGGPAELSGNTAIGAFALTLLGNGIALSGAWFGGELVFGYRVGVAPADAEPTWPVKNTAAPAALCDAPADASLSD